ncbi:hypothetical protein B0H15DRAFT_749641, partial [Mycena belliarum]
VSPETSETETTGTKDEVISLKSYSAAFPRSPAHTDLWGVRNLRPSFGTRAGMLGGVLYSGVDTMLRGRVPWTLKHHGAGVSFRAFSISYPPFEPPLSTDLLTSVALTGTNHAEGQAIQLRV